MTFDQDENIIDDENSENKNNPINAMMQVFGTSKPNVNIAWAQSGALVDPGPTKTALGWVVEKPAYQTFNFELNRGDTFNKHVNEYGICVWDGITSYSVNSIVQGSDGYVYQSIQNTNVNNNPSGGLNPTFWTSLSEGISTQCALVGTNAYTTTIPSLTSYYQGLTIVGFGALANTGASSLNINSLGSKPLVKTSGEPLNAGDIPLNGILSIIYDGTSFQLLNVNTNSPRYLTSSGTDTYTATSLGIPYYYTGLIVDVLIANANATTTPTLNINGLGAATIVISNGGALVAGDLAAGQSAQLLYNGSQFILLNPSFSDNSIVAASYAGNGYVVFRNNLIIQWGISVFIQGGAVTAFPISFRSSAFSLTVSQFGATSPAAIMGASALAAATFTAASNNPGSNAGAWIAMGF